MRYNDGVAMIRLPKLGLVGESPVKFRRCAATVKVRMPAS